MINLARWTVVVACVCLFLGCGGSDSNNDAAAGTGGGSAGAGGAAGTGGGGGGTSGASCQACVACVMTNCGTPISTCQGNTACNAIYDCARMCQMDVNDCIAANMSGVTVWAGVSACLNQNCLPLCNY